MLTTPAQGAPLDRALARCAALHRALSVPSRLEIMVLLSAGPTSVRDLAHLAGLESSLVSHHLGRLRKVGLVACDQSGHLRMYRLGDGAAVTVTDGRMVMQVGSGGVSVSSALPRAVARGAGVELKPAPQVRSDPGAPRAV